MYKCDFRVQDETETRGLIPYTWFQFVLWQTSSCSIQLTRSEHHSTRVFHRWNMVRKHSPRRYRPGGPFGHFRHFQCKSVYLTFFLAFATSKNAFQKILRNMPSIIFLDLSESALHFSAEECGNLLRRLFFGNFSVQKIYVDRKQQQMRPKIRIAESSDAE